jgi:GntR family transcriptional regulator
METRAVTLSGVLLPTGGWNTVRIIIQNTSKAPIYEQIEEQIKEAILCDELKEGDLLPSIRQLAKDLKISVITTTRAYAELEQEGYIVVQQGRGCFVLPKNSEMVREQLLRKIEDGFTAAVNAARVAKLSREELLKILDFILAENLDE